MYGYCSKIRAKIQQLRVVLNEVDAGDDAHGFVFGVNYNHEVMFGEKQ